jgi:hypothetical protein
MTEPTHVLVPRKITEAQADAIGMPSAWYERAVGRMAVSPEAGLPLAFPPPQSTAAPPPPAPPAEAARIADMERRVWVLKQAGVELEAERIDLQARIVELEGLVRVLAEENEALKLRNAEVSMLAHKWMVAHDMLKEGKPYEYPTPADLPNAVAENTRLREALWEYGGDEAIRAARAALASAPAQPEGPKRAPDRPDLAALIDWAREHPPSDEQLAEQAKSWVRGEMAIGSDADEAEYRRRMREEKAQTEEGRS